MTPNLMPSGMWRLECPTCETVAESPRAVYATRWLRDHTTTHCDGGAS